MASEGLIGALAANWDDGRSATGRVGGPVTLKSLIVSLQAWMDGTSTVDLTPSLKQLREQVAEAARATELDLRQELAPELEASLRGSLEVYEDLDPVLEVLGKAYAAGNRAIKNMLALLEGAREDLRGHDEAMQAWLRAPVLRCPRCGRTPTNNAYVCPQCRVDMLYPDPESVLDDSQNSAQVGPEFVAVFEALSLVVRGEAPLSRLLAVLQGLEQSLSAWADIAEDEESSNVQLAYALDTVADAARRALQGTAQMRSVAQTRQTRDLNEGWHTVFEAAQEIRAAIPTLSKHAGAPAGDHFSTQARFQDAIILEGD